MGRLGDIDVVKELKFGDLRVAWLEAFVAVAESGKQTAAAAELGISQTAVSRQLENLRVWLGNPILFDTDVPANLYPAGERFLPVAKEIIRLLSEARSFTPAGVRDGGAEGPE